MANSRSADTALGALACASGLLLAALHTWAVWGARAALPLGDHGVSLYVLERVAAGELP